MWAQANLVQQRQAQAQAEAERRRQDAAASEERWGQQQQAERGARTAAEAQWRSAQVPTDSVPLIRRRIFDRHLLNAG